MKRLLHLLFLILSVSIAIAQNDQPPVKLVGLVDAFGMKLAVIQTQSPGRSSHWGILLKEGQGQGDIEVSRIDSSSGKVSVSVARKPYSLTLNEPDGPGATNKMEHLTPPVIDLVSADLDAALTLYAEFKSRTVLQHPGLRDGPFSLKCNPQTINEAAAEFERMFNEQKIATIPDGNRFVMVVPFAFTNDVKPGSGLLPQTNATISQFSVNFVDAPLHLVLQTYSDFAGKKLGDLRGAPQMSPVTLRQTTPLSRSELIYALETQIAWRNIRFVPDANGHLKWGWIHPPD